MKLFKMGKNVRKEKDLVWYMVGETVKRSGTARLYLSCQNLLKFLLVKLQNRHTSASLNLDYDTTKQKQKM